MEPIFSYAILKGVPDPRRGERVNVGVIVFLADRVDVRFSEISKLQALSAGNWDQYVAEVKGRLSAAFSAGESPQAFLARASALESVIRFSDVAWFSASSAEEYEAQIRDTMRVLVIKPKPLSKPRTTGINAEIAKVFRRANALSAPGENIDNKKIHTEYQISQEDDLTADFIVKNGVYHVTATLDLRRVAASKGQAAIKAITLDQAGAAFKGHVHKLAVYAATPDSDQFRPHIHMLKEYADSTFNWVEPDQQKAYLNEMYEAMRHAPNPLGLN